MKTFKILNKTISFDEGIIDYINIMQDSNSYKLNFNDRYMSKPKKNIISFEDFTLYVQELYNNGFAKEFLKLSEELVNLYIKHGIYDMSKEMIEAKNTRFLSSHLERLNPILEEIATFSSQVNQNVIDIQSKWENMIDEAVPGHYFNVYSPHYSDILLNDYFNHKEEKRVEKKRERLYNKYANKNVNDYLSQIVPLCEEYINQIQQLIYEDVIQAIDSMYKNCAIDLVAKGKISSFIQYTDNLKSTAILDNIDRIADKAVAEEQIVNLLQIDPLNPKVHLKILEYITYNDISEYAEVIQFFKLENMIFYIYVEDSSKRENGNKDLNNKCLNILKLVKDSLNMGIISKGNASFPYTDDVFIETIKATKIYFECLKNIFGADNKTINEKEHQMFEKAIKEVSKGTNLVYDRNLLRIDYDYLCEFWARARKKRNLFSPNNLNTTEKNINKSNISSENTATNTRKKSKTLWYIWFVILAILGLSAEDFKTAFCIVTVFGIWPYLRNKKESNCMGSNLVINYLYYCWLNCFLKIIKEEAEELKNILMINLKMMRKFEKPILFKV